MVKSLVSSKWRCVGGSITVTVLLMYLGDVLDCEGGVERAVQARVTGYAHRVARFNLFF